jgi:hypothetical protein
VGEACIVAMAWLERIRVAANASHKPSGRRKLNIADGHGWSGVTGRRSCFRIVVVMDRRMVEYWARERSSS